MNVYVRELASHLARLGHNVDVYTRRDSPSQRDRVNVEPGVTVHHISAGRPEELVREQLADHLDEFAEGVAARFRCRGLPDVLHANYWLSGTVGHRLKHEFSLPLIATFHMLERVKAETFETESAARALEEERIIGCCDAVLASCEVEADQIATYYGADPARIHIVALGVEQAFFSPGHRPQARRALGLDPALPHLLFVGRLQALKGVDLALETLIELRAGGLPARLAIVGGPSGPSGRDTLEALHARVNEAGVVDAVSLIAPQPHQLLSSWYRAADVTVVPSRAESFGLVALESAACGTPVVASKVGGLATLVHHEQNGLLVESRDPAQWAEAVRWCLDDSRSTSLSVNAVLSARSYTWRSAAEAVTELVERLRQRELVACS